MLISTDINSFWVVSNFLKCVVTFVPLNKASHHILYALDNLTPV
jgi:hypothetical protein